MEESFSRSMLVLKRENSDVESIKKALQELEGIVPSTKTEIKSYKHMFYNLARGYQRLDDAVKCVFYMHRALQLDPLHKPTLELFQVVADKYAKEIETEFAKEKESPEPSPSVSPKTPEISISTEKDDPKVDFGLNGNIEVGAIDFRGLPLIQSEELLRRITPTDRDEILKNFSFIVKEPKKKKKRKLYFTEVDFVLNNPHMNYFCRFETFKILRSSSLFVPFYSTILVSDLSTNKKCEIGLGFNRKCILQDGHEKERFDPKTFSPKIWVDQYFLGNAIFCHGSLFESLNLLFESILVHRERIIRKKTFREYTISSLQLSQQQQSPQSPIPKDDGSEDHDEQTIGYSEFDNFLSYHYRLLLEMKLLPEVDGTDEKQFNRFITKNTKSIFKKLLGQHQKNRNKKRSKRLSKVEFMTSGINFHHRLVHYNLIDDSDYIIQEEKEGEDVRSAGMIGSPKFYTDTTQYKKFGRLLHFGTKEFNFGFFILYGMTLMYQKHKNCRRCSNVTPEDFYDTYLLTLPNININKSFSGSENGLISSPLPSHSSSDPFTESSSSKKANYPTRMDPIGGKFRTYENTVVQMKSYCYYVFRRLRQMFGIDDRSFFEDTFSAIKFLGNFLLLNRNRSLIFQSSMGRSGTFFFYSNDGKYLVKKLTLKEFKIFINTLPQYYAHQLYHNNNQKKSNDHKKIGSLLTQYVYCFTLHIKPRRKKVISIEFVDDMLFRTDDFGETYYFVVMKNVFSTNNEIHEIYDLKGSKLSRSSKGGPIQKDNDLKRKLSIGSEKKEELFRILNNDVEMLNFLELTDYSLLLGVNYRRGRRSTILPHQYYPKGINQKLDLKQLSRKVRQIETKKKREGNASSKTKHENLRNQMISLRVPRDMDRKELFKQMSEVKGDGEVQDIFQEIDENELKKRTEEEEEEEEEDPFAGFAPSPPTSLDLKKKKEEEENSKQLVFEEDGGIISSNYKETYYFGIIDMLTKFTFTKYAERNLKTLRNLGNKEDISAAPHEYYSKRFLYFLDNVFK